MWAMKLSFQAEIKKKKETTITKNAHLPYDLQDREVLMEMCKENGLNS